MGPITETRGKKYEVVSQVSQGENKFPAPLSDTKL